MIDGIENVVTGSGDDVITASNAANVMDGGAGHDVYRFMTVDAADNDVILSFEPGDIIDLSRIDANEGLRGNQAFTITSGAFTGAGQLMVTEDDRDGTVYTVVRGTVDNDGDSDFTIEIRGSHALTAGDFNL
jgi:hypothetical protein